jgi:hypothetical protein
VIATLVAGLVLTATAASGADDGSTYTHYSPDAGYDRAFLVSCPHGWERVREGYGSMEYCGLTMDGDDATLGIYIRRGEELWCKYMAPDGSMVWLRRVDRRGWDEPHWNWSDGWGCTLRRD